MMLDYHNPVHDDGTKKAYKLTIIYQCGCKSELYHDNKYLLTLVGKYIKSDFINQSFEVVKN